MSYDVVALIAGIVLLVVALLGGGITGQFDIPKLEQRTRQVVGILGAVFILVSYFIHDRDKVPLGPAPTATSVAFAPPSVPVPTDTATSLPTAIASPLAPSATIVATEQPTAIATALPTTAVATSTAGPSLVPTLTALPEFAPDEAVIAVQLPLGTPRGQELLKSIQFAFDDLKGKFQGLKVRLLPLDDEGLGKKGHENAQVIQDHPQALCVTGHNLSGVVLESMDVYNDAKVSIISMGATNSNITDFKNPYGVFLRVLGRDDIQSKVAVKFIKEKLSNVRKIYVIQDTNGARKDYSSYVADGFATEAAKLGLNVTTVRYDTDDPGQVEAQMQMVVQAAPDLIFYAGYAEQGGPILGKVAPVLATTLFFGASGLDRSSMAQDLKGNINRLYYVTGAAPLSEFPDALDEARRYRQNYGDPPPSFAESYDTVGMCLWAIDRAVKNNPGHLPTPDQVRAEFEALRTESYQGISGKYRFTKQGDPVESFYYIRQGDATKLWSENPVAYKDQLPPPER